MDQILVALSARLALLSAVPITILVVVFLVRITRIPILPLLVDCSANPTLIRPLILSVPSQAAYSVKIIKQTRTPALLLALVLPGLVKIVLLEEDYLAANLLKQADFLEITIRTIPPIIPVHSEQRMHLVPTRTKTKTKIKIKPPPVDFLVANLPLEVSLGAKAPRTIPVLVTTNPQILVVDFLEISLRQQEGGYLVVETIPPVEEDCLVEAPTLVLLV